YYLVLLWKNNKVIKARDVTFEENNFSFVKRHTNDGYKSIMAENILFPIPSLPHEEDIAADFRGDNVHQEKVTSSEPIQIDANSSDITVPPVPVEVLSQDNPRVRFLGEEIVPVVSSEYNSPNIPIPPEPSPNPPSYKIEKIPRSQFNPITQANIIDGIRSRTPSQKNKENQLHISESQYYSAEVGAEFPIEAIEYSFNSEEFDDGGLDDLEPDYIPKQYKDAIKSKNVDQWNDAMKSEYESLILNNVFEKVPRPKGGNVIGGRWVYAKKLTKWGKVKRF